MRIQWIDRARGYGLLLVVAGHLGIPFFGKYITSFHMPLFFFLSGITFSASGTFRDFLIKKVRRLIVPYFCLGIPLVLASFVTRIASGVTDYRDYLDVAARFLIQKRMYTIWFLTCLFFLNILFYLLVKLTKNRLYVIGIVSFVLAGLGLCYYSVLGGQPLPWNIDVCLTAAPFFFGGYLYRNRFAGRRTLSSWPVFVLSAVLNLVLVTVNYKVSGEVFNMALNDYGMPVISFLAICTGIYCVCFISDKFKFRCVEYLGKNTMIYFAWHQTIALPLGLLILDFIPYFNADTIISDAMRTVILFIFMFAFLFPFDRLTQNTKLRFMVGKYAKS